MEKGSGRWGGGFLSKRFSEFREAKDPAFSVRLIGHVGVSTNRDLGSTNFLVCHVTGHMTDHVVYRKRWWSPVWALQQTHDTTYKSSLECWLVYSLWYVWSISYEVETKHCSWGGGGAYIYHKCGMTRKVDRTQNQLHPVPECSLDYRLVTLYG